MKQPTVAAASARVFDLSLGEMLWSRRSVFLALVAGGPVVLAVVVRLATASFGPLEINGAGVSGGALFGLAIWLLYIRFIVPVLGIFYGTSLIAGGLFVAGPRADGASESPRGEMAAVRT